MSKDASRLNAFTERAADPTPTLNFLKENHNDPNAMSTHLFGDVWGKDLTCLDALKSPSDDVSEEEIQPIRNLLLKSNMFNWKLFDYSQPREDLHLSTYQNLSELSYELDIQECSIDTSSVDKMLEGNENLKLLIEYLIKMHRCFRPDYPGYKQIKHEFHNFLRNMDQFLSTFGFHGAESTLEKGWNIDFAGDPYTIWPDGLMRADKELTETRILPDKTTMMVYQFKGMPLLSEELVSDPNNLKIDTDALKADFEQLAGTMLLIGAPFGACTDGNSLIFLEIDQEAIEQKKGKLGGTNIPIKLYSTHIRATRPSFIEVWCWWYLKCLTEVSKRQMMKDLKYDYFTDHSRYSFKLKPNFDPLYGPSDYYHFFIADVREGEYSVIQAGECSFQVFKVSPRKRVFPLGHKIDRQEQVVLKLFEERASLKSWQEKYYYKDIPRILYNIYDKETECIKRLTKDPEFNNCFYDYGRVRARVCTPLGEMRGRCIISKFIKTITMPRDEETYEKLKRQLGIVHKHGIRHNGIAPRNILYGEDRKVYIIDFGAAKILDSDDKDRYLLDVYWLKYYFKP